MTEKLQNQLMERVRREHEQAPHPSMEGSRLRLHLAVHVVVETQVKAGAPAIVAATLDRLQREGLDRHEAVHAIGSVASEEVVVCLARGQAYDEERYTQRLAELSAASWNEAWEQAARQSGEGEADQRQADTRRGE
jgi:hypothetical protein